MLFELVVWYEYYWKKKLALDLAFCFQQLNISKQKKMEFVLLMNP